MKNVKALLLYGSMFMLASSCGKPSHTVEVPLTKDLYHLIADSSATYDSTMAKHLNADEYGMHRYVMAFLKKGPKRDQDSVTAAQLQKAHLENIIRMANEGTLVLAGPFMDDGEVRGIYIFNVPTIEEAHALTASDPAIQAGRLAMELHPWYGSASLPLITPLHKKLEKTSVAK